MDSATIAEMPSTLRSRVTNGSRLLFSNGRSAGARRFRDIHDAYVAELGVPLVSLPLSVQQLIRNLAQITIELELLQDQRASGSAIDPVAFVTLVNSQRRALKDLDKAQAKLSARRPTLAEQLAAEAA